MCSNLTLRCFVLLSSAAGIWLCLLCGTAIAQQSDSAAYRLAVKPAGGAILIDGVLEETGWRKAEPANNFFQNFPFDSSYAQTRTEAFITYDKHNLYIAAICHDTLPGDYVVTSLQRDFDIQFSDAFAVLLDPYNDELNGFTFALNPYGVQREGLLSEGGGDWGSDLTWDNKWFSAVKRHPGRWVVEIAIPFKTLRYKAGNPIWRINFARYDRKRNEISSWVPVPRNFEVSMLAFTGYMNWESPPEKPGANISLIPYAIGGVDRDYELGQQWQGHYNAGGDAKVAVTPSLTLDLTVNPDFSQVDVDRQITNLTRFNLFFPEQRQFFIENSDLFERFGFRQIRPFFSRRIGLHQGHPIPILGGARLSGKVNRNWRIGAMNIQTEGTNIETADGGAQHLKSRNYTVAAFQRQVFQRSNIAGIFVNQQAFNGFEPDGQDYNRVAGLDYNIASANNRWRGKVFYHHSFTPEQMRDQGAHAAWLMYDDQHLMAMWNHEYVGANYLAETGFVPRLDNYDVETGEIIRMAYWRYEPIFEYRFFPKSQVINNHGPWLYSSLYLDRHHRFFENLYQVGYEVQFQSTAAMSVHYKENYLDLRFPIDITRTGADPLPAQEYTYRSVEALYNSDRRKVLNWEAQAEYGSFYNGTKLTYRIGADYRAQPWGIFNFHFKQDKVDLPPPYASVWLTSVGTRIDLSFTKSLFFTSFIQYNNQLDNINVNTRLQWRFRPMSDLFIVYTDNYDVVLREKNRALVCKLVYWFTL